MRFRYDVGYEPPAPVLLAAVCVRAGMPQAVVPALVDSGADCTVLPESVSEALALPRVGWFGIEGVGGRRIRVPRHVARVAVGALCARVQVAVFGNEALLGRDWLNRAVARLDGPRLALTLSRSARGR